MYIYIYIIVIHIYIYIYIYIYASVHALILTKNVFFRCKGFATAHTPANRPKN